jgi:hypothetical protein
MLIIIPSHTDVENEDEFELTINNKNLTLKFMFMILPSHTEVENEDGFEDGGLKLTSSIN